MHSLAVEQEFTNRAGRLKAWGSGLLVVAGLLWVYAAWQMFVPYTDHHYSKTCAGPAFADRRGLYVDDHNGSYEAAEDQDHLERCAASRDWPAPVAALVVATPLGVVGGMMAALGGSGLRIRALERQMESARAAEARSAKSKS